jgi:hypothetical protein
VPPTTIDEVVDRLGEVVDRCQAEGSRIGYFAAVYRQMTVAVRQAMAAGAFDDGPRMDRLAGAFAARYLVALDRWEQGGEPTRSWRIAFECAEQADRVILQHVILGINAHVNLDLGVAAAEVAPGAAIRSLHGDFRRINDVIGGLLDGVQAAIGRFSPLLDLLWRLADRPDDELLNFSFRVARDEAWNRARILAAQPRDAWPPTIDTFDRAAALLARLVVNPGGILRRAVDIVHHTESDDVPAVIDALGRVVPGASS